MQNSWRSGPPDVPLPQSWHICPLGKKSPNFFLQTTAMGFFLLPLPPPALCSDEAFLKVAPQTAVSASQGNLVKMRISHLLLPRPWDCSPEHGAQQSALTNSPSMPRYENHCFRNTDSKQCLGVALQVRGLHPQNLVELLLHQQHSGADLIHHMGLESRGQKTGGRLFSVIPGKRFRVGRYGAGGGRSFIFSF